MSEAKEPLRRLPIVITLERIEKWNGYWTNQMGDSPAIVRAILEGAGRVDKDRAIRTLATLLLVYTESEGRIIPALEKALKDGAVREIRALLEALPG